MVLMLKDWVNADTRADDPNMSILEKQNII
jgi:hypothetical protein